MGTVQILRWISFQKKFTFLSTRMLFRLFYYDDLEICNPLGSKKSVHKLGMIQ